MKKLGKKGVDIPWYLWIALLALLIVLIYGAVKAYNAIISI